MDNYRYCEHKIYGVGSAILIKHRRKPDFNLWMVEFQSTKERGKEFYLSRDFISMEEVWIIDEERATALYKEGRKGGSKKRTINTQKEDPNITDFLDSLF